jgi:hypothetical protein
LELDDLDSDGRISNAEMFHLINKQGIEGQETTSRRRRGTSMLSVAAATDQALAAYADGEEIAAEAVATLEPALDIILSSRRTRRIASTG